jgi:hypothetical protein
VILVDKTFPVGINEARGNLEEKEKKNERPKQKLPERAPTLDGRDEMVKSISSP